MQQMRREVTLTPGPVIVRGNMSARNKKKKKFADYVLSWEPGIPIAVVEPKTTNTASVAAYNRLSVTQKFCKSRVPSAQMVMPGVFITFVFMIYAIPLVEDYGLWELTRKPGQRYSVTRPETLPPTIHRLNYRNLLMRSPRLRKITHANLTHQHY